MCNNQNAYLRKQGVYIEIKQMVNTGIYSEGVLEWDVRWLKKDGVSQNELAALDEEVAEAADNAYSNHVVERSDDDYRDLWVCELVKLGWERVQMSFSYDIGECHVSI